MSICKSSSDGVSEVDGHPPTLEDHILLFCIPCFTNSQNRKVSHVQRTLLYIDLIRTLIQVASITEQVFATQEHVT